MDSELAFVLIVVGFVLLTVAVTMPAPPARRVIQSESEREALRRERLGGRVPTAYTGPTFNAHGRELGNPSGYLPESSGVRRVL